MPDPSPPRIKKFQYPLRNQAYGYPRGKERKVDPWVLICIHITGNKNTASMPVGIKPGTGTYAEVSYMARDRKPPNLGNSAHDYIARDGSVLACIPTKYAAWNNGALNRPNTDLSSVKRIVKSGVNPNEAYVREVECTGYPGSYRVTKEQRETVAYLIARDSIRTGLPINRETVHLHSDLDSVNRANCPFTGDREAQVEAIIERAKAIKKALKNPEPEPEPEEPCDRVEELEAALKAAEGLVDTLEERITILEADLESAHSRIEILESSQPNTQEVFTQGRQSFKDQVIAIQA